MSWVEWVNYGYGITSKDIKDEKITLKKSYIVF